MKIKFLVFLLSTFFSVIINAGELGSITPEQLIEMQKNSNALVIDIRTEKEWETTGTIPNSHKLEFFSPSGNYNTKKWLADLNQLKATSDQAVILVCRSGNRSGKVGDILTKQIGMSNIHHLSNGLMSWIKAGNKISRDCTNKLACK